MSLAALTPEINKLVEGFSGFVSYSILCEETGERIDLNKDVLMPTASTMKVFCLAKLLQMVDEGKISLNDKVVMTEANCVRGSGVLKELQLGLELTVRDACMLMVIVSDNTATNMVIDLVGGIDVVNDFLKKYGMAQSRLNNRVEFDKINTASDLAVATSDEFLRFLMLVKNTDMLSDKMKEEYFDILSRQQCVDQFPRYMPYNQYAADVNQPCDMRVFNKTGFMVEVRVDVGYLERNGKHISYAIMTDKCADLSFLAENEANVTIGRIGKLVFDEILA